ncbi:MAG: DUF2760 domain-containing protein [Desulfobacterales bacterium]
MPEKIRAYSHARWAFILLGLFFGAVLGTLGYFLAAEIIRDVQPLLSDPGASLPHADAWRMAVNLFPHYWYTTFPFILLLAVAAALIALLFVRPSLKGAAVPSTKPQSVPQMDAEEIELSDRRLFLHMFAAMQRDGRLMDFLSEDLDQYDDAQIGSAVRNIHAGCRKVVQKYLHPEPVMEEDEGETVTLPADFDPGLITLTGKVTGKPPFKGILRHKGWQVGKIELPKLSGRQNARIIAPAEIEVT